MRLYAHRSGVRLLKCLCQTEDEKAVAWHSDANSLERQGIPREFTTKSRVAIISNDWKTLDKNVAALQDRGHVLMFDPDAVEVHRKAGTWFYDVEIYEWFAKNLHRVREPSMRHYVRAKELKAAGMDWTEVLAAETENKRARLAAELLASAAHDSTAARVKAFVGAGVGAARRSSTTAESSGAGTGAVMEPDKGLGARPGRADSGGEGGG